MTVRARMRLPSVTVCTQHTEARTAVVVRRMRVSVLLLGCVEGRQVLGTRRQLFALALPSVASVSQILTGSGMT